MKKNSGFSLIEVIVAMVLIGIISAAFFGVYFSSIKASTHHKVRLEGLMIAQDLIEEVRSARDQTDYGDFNLNQWLNDSDKYTVSSGNSDIWEAVVTNSEGYNYYVEFKVNSLTMTTIANENSNNSYNIQEIVINVNSDYDHKPAFLVARIRGGN